MTDDDRVRCATCCLASIGKKRCMELDLGVDLELPRRCLHYIPTVADLDQRSGRDRWPDFTRQVELARAEDQAFWRKAKRRKSPEFRDSAPEGKPGQ